MKAKGLVMVLKSEEFVEVLLDVQLTQAEAAEIGVNVVTILNLVYDPDGEIIITALLEGTEAFEISLTNEEVEHVNQFIYDNGIYDEVLEALGLAQAS
ncbi:hypothetical protein [Paenibacillus cremeus]|uniref:Uncharacterized protein n=1 Tax=Paenibacillus cremeus TaxID=2163881 RepID=A0A559KCQ0_9BACL|nr:hypothetical protein [Paenibacillus cremeus]TVY09912.1 hypothetical protein FPZ49_11110 [Paenibacillus cremeus]